MNEACPDENGERGSSLAVLSGQLLEFIRLRRAGVTIVAIALRPRCLQRG